MSKNCQKDKLQQVGSNHILIVPEPNVQYFTESVRLSKYIVLSIYEGRQLARGTYRAFSGGKNVSIAINTFM